MIYSLIYIINCKHDIDTYIVNYLIHNMVVCYYNVLNINLQYKSTSEMGSKLMKTNNLCHLTIVSGK